MRYHTFMFFLISFSFITCKSNTASSSETDLDNTTSEINLDNIDLSSEVNLDVKMDEVIPDDQLAKKIIIESQKQVVNENAKVVNKNETTLVGKSIEQKAKDLEVKKEATKNMIEQSVNKGKSCDQILKDQEAFIDKFAQTKDRKIIIEMSKAKNDPFFAECSKSEEFSSKIDELDDKLASILDQE